MPRKPSAFCSRGHDMSKTRVMHGGEPCCSVCKRAGIDRYQKAHPEMVKKIARKHYLKKFYGVTPDMVDGKPCGICGTTDFVIKRSKNGDIRHAHTDHDHETGKFRGVLCHRCNLGIGLLGPNLAKALDYVNKERP